MNCEATITDLAKAEAPENWVREVLEPDQLTTARMHFGRKKLTKGTLVLLWALRVYVVFMICIMALAVWNTLHTAG